MTHDDTILITGATGGIGSQVLTELQELGKPVRAMCRRPEQLRAFERRGIPAVLGDLADPDSLDRAMIGVETLFLLTLAGRDQVDHGRNAVSAAERAGVGRVVHLSTADAAPSSNVPWAAAPARTDALLRVSGLRWTLLKPTAFMQNLLDSAAVIRRGFLPQTTGEGVVGWIDTSDIAAVAAQVLVDDQYDGQELFLTGPELLAMRDLAATLSEVLECKVRFVNLPAPVFGMVLRLSGMDAWQAKGLVHQFADIVRNGKDHSADLTDTVAAITGHSPRTFHDFVQSHRDELLRL